MKQILSCCLLLLISVAGFSQGGQVKESLKIESTLLGGPVEYSVYLPAGYETSNRSYPVLYLLHGYSDNETGWVQFGDVARIADEGIAKGDVSPVIIVMPNGKVTWYCNDYKMANPWEDMFVKEFIPTIEKTYRIRSKKEFRAISGLSMGGYGSLMLSMRNPDLFSSCVAFSSGTFTDQEIVNMPDDNYKMYFGDIFGHDLKGEQRISDNWKVHSPLHLIYDVPKDKLKGIRFYIDCGDDDFLFEGNSQLHIQMRKQDIPHEYRTRQGGHEWGYWRSGLVEGLKFISQSFHR
ncbi:MAG: alpha/beta hydrolase [Candidatus Saccharibacteria bacterium]